MKVEVVWSVSANRINQLSRLSDLLDTEQIRLHYPSRLDPKFTVENRDGLPFARRYV